MAGTATFFGFGPLYGDPCPRRTLNQSQRLVSSLYFIILSVLLRDAYWTSVSGAWIGHWDSGEKSVPSAHRLEGEGRLVITGCGLNGAIQACWH